MDRRFFIVILIVLASLVGIFALTNKSTSEGNNGSGDKRSNNTYGKLDSPVTLTEFVDFQCEACYAYYPYVKQVKEQYKDKVRFEIRYFPITSSHQFSFIAARNAESAARQGKFWEMHDKIFEGQKSWEQTKDPQPTFDQYAQSIGLDMTKFKTDRESSDVSSVVNKDLKDVQALGGTGTPTFALNGQKIESPKPSAEEISKVLDEALKKAGLEPGPSATAPRNDETTGTGAMPMSPSGVPSSGGSGGLAPGEKPEDHAKETQGQ